MENQTAASFDLRRRASACIAAAALTGCGAAYVYREAVVPQTTRAAEQALLEMARDPKPFRRRLLLIHGWRGSARRWDSLVYWLGECMTNYEKLHAACTYETGKEAFARLVEEEKKHAADLEEARR